MSVVDLPAAADDGRLLVRPTELGRRRPVLVFVGVIALVAVVLLVVGRSGVLAPQAELDATGSLGDGTTSYAPTYSLANHGWRPIEVDVLRAPTGVRLAQPDAGFDPMDAAHQRTEIEDVPVFAPFTLAGGGHRTLVVPLPCADETVRPILLEVRVRSVDTGLARTLRVDLGEALPCP